MQYVVIGLGNGAIYALLAIAIVVVFQSSGVLNFAQGELGTLAAHIAWSMTGIGLPLVAAAGVAVVAGCGLSLLAGMVMLHLFGDAQRDPLPAATASLGLLLVVNSAVHTLWDADAEVFPPLVDGSAVLAGVDITWQRVTLLAVVPLLVLTLWLVTSRTELGLAVRATASSRLGARLAGVRVDAVSAGAWGAGGAVSSVAAIFFVGGGGLSPDLMLIPLVYALAAVMLGGRDSVVGAAVGGLLVGLVSDVVPRYLTWFAGMPFVPVVVLVLAVLLVRPKGLFGRPVERHA